jgi:outer membrane autotransporter protein
MSTERTVFGGSRLTADFNAYSFGGRLEGGARLETEEGSEITPYAALQTQSFLTSGYSEDDPANSGFALSYGPRASTSVRGEFGARFDHALELDDDGTLLKLNARLAYAHDWIDDPSLTATFQALPGASFIVNGATPPGNLALTSLGAELVLDNGVTLSGRFDGEFAPGAVSCAGIAALRVSW